ncbi:MAG: chromate resistance protein [Blastocatellia bacterium]|nr:chromate resistance protein [Blastocatellia bacterium]
MSNAQGRWLLLIHQIPPKPAYFRAKVLRRLQQLGALPLKNSAYVLPHNEETLEDFQWTLRDIVADGGEAWLFQTTLISGLTDDLLAENFRKLRAEDYQVLHEFGYDLLTSVRNATPETDRAALETEWRKLKRRVEEVRRLDFFHASGREELENLMQTIDATLHPVSRAQPASRLAELTGRTWVTRQGVKVDRLASVWLIRRWIDPAGRFLFVDPATYAPEPDHLRFDMFEGEFTHEGNLCTFEVLLNRYGSQDPALAAIGEIVHDLDIKDGKYQRPEAAGFKSVIEGITAGFPEDLRRVETATIVLDALYRQFQSTQGISLEPHQ